MGKLYFLLAVHNHQPVGNFEHVFEEAWRRSYVPFLDILKKHPAIRASMHYSGPLLEWIEEKHSETFSELKLLAKRGQIEFLGGGFYEPILPSITKVDADGHLALMNDYINKKFSQTPEGMWLAERVWEPQLPSLIHSAGLRYTLLDDTHFLYAGLEREELCGYYMTEDAGLACAVFPINKQLRYLVPFSEPRGALDYMRQVADRLPGTAITLGDDGEKFGLWPGTYKWVYEEKYLDRFFKLIEDNGDWLEMMTMGEYLKKFPPTGKVQLPTASYDEMMEWSLPANVQKAFKQLVEELKAEHRFDQYSRFLRGGFWRNFLVKYPESNLQRSKAIHVSRMVHEALPDDLETHKSLWRSQCNCAYWHGLFGGVYLNYLRNANYTNVLKAEIMADRACHKEKEWLACEQTDYDQDGRDEILLRSATLNAFISPAYGGSLFELDYKPRCYNLLNTMSRHEEAYHAAMVEQAGKKAAGEAAAPASIHNMAKTAPRELLNALHYDWYLRRSFLDHFLGAATNLHNFMNCDFPELGNFVNQPYIIQSLSDKGDKIIAALRRQGIIYSHGGKRAVQIDKTFCLSKNGILNVDYRVLNQSDHAIDIWMGVELNMTLLSGNQSERHLAYKSKKETICKAGEQGGTESISSVDLVSTIDKFRANISWSEPADFWHFPLQTVSQSEKGFDMNYQGTVMLPQFEFTLKPGGNKKLAFEINIQNI